MTAPISDERLAELIVQLRGRANMARATHPVDAEIDDTAADALELARARIGELQTAYDVLTGEKFSDRVHAALKSRAEKAEAELAGVRAGTHQIVPRAANETICQAGEKYMGDDSNSSKLTRLTRAAQCWNDTTAALKEASGEKP